MDANDARRACLRALPLAVHEFGWSISDVRVKDEFAAVTMTRDAVRLVVAVEFSHSGLEAAFVASLRAMWPWLSEKRDEL